MMAALESAMREKTSQGSVEARAIDNIGTLESCRVRLAKYGIGGAHIYEEGSAAMK